MKKTIHKYKCKICKSLIEPNDLFVVNHITKSGNKSIQRFHEDCYKKQQINKKEKDKFYKYIEDNFFNICIPTLFFADISKIKGNCSYNDILDCCIDIDLIGIISKKDFKNDRVKTKYIIEVIKSNINKYMDKKMKMDMEYYISHNFLDRSKYKYKTSMDLNI
jgi:hypothetical protein